MKFKMNHQKNIMHIFLLIVYDLKSGNTILLPGNYI